MRGVSSEQAPEGTKNEAPTGQDEAAPQGTASSEEAPKGTETGEPSQGMETGEVPPDSTNAPEPSEDRRPKEAHGGEGSSIAPEGEGMTSEASKGKASVTPSQIDFGTPEWQTFIARIVSDCTVDPVGRDQDLARRLAEAEARNQVLLKKMETSERGHTQVLR